MALEIKFGVCVIKGCTQIRITDNTGTYGVSNLTGYGAPNYTTADIDTAILNITAPGGTLYSINLLADAVLPTATSGIYYDIPLSMMGNLTNIVDGQWHFEYEITMLDTVVVSTAQYAYFYCNSECCVTNMLPKVTTCDCCLNDVSSTNYITAWTFLQSLKDAAICGDYTNFTTIKKIVDKLCLNNGCVTCK